LIPVDLKLTNFMSYKNMDEPLSFSSIHTAVLCGPNGHGKSSLLDAVTWALWGRARGVDKRGSGTDDLIHHKEPHMQVEFSFELEGQHYRVVRSRARKGKTGVSRLEFQILDDSTNTQRSITGETIGATQEAINRTLRIDYDTFVNSAFVMQGRADTFMTRTANERKIILAEILGLSVYDELEELARSKRRENNDRLKLIDDRISYIDREIEQLPALEQEIAQTVVELTTIQNGIRNIEAGLAGLQKDKAIYDMKTAQLDELKKRSANSKTETAAIEDRLAKLNAGINAARTLVDRMDEINKGYAELIALRAREEQLAQAGQKYGALETKANALKLTIAKAKSEIEANLNNLSNKKSEIEKQLSKRKTIKAELIANKAKLAEFDNDEQQLTKMREAYAEKQQEQTAAKAESQAIEAKLIDIEKRHELLTDGDSCPLCKKPLDEKERGDIRFDVEREREQARNDLEALHVLAVRYANELEDLKKTGIRLSEKLKGKNEFQIREGTLNEKLKALDQAESELANVNLQHSDLRLAAAQGIYAQTEQSELKRLEDEMKLIGYSVADHQSVRDAVKKASGYEQLRAELESARTGISATETAIASLINQRQSLAASIKDDEHKTAAIAKEISGTGDIATGLQELETKLVLQRQSEAATMDRRASMQAKIDNLTELKKQKKTLLKERAGTARDATVYDTLAFAFGKKGIQALIIENAVPEIEEEANTLLRRLTNNQMNLRFITQKDQRTGGVIETLDLIIADGDLGDRKYELFSGGEAFRINFAVRIALSKLLARRAGARLETLVVDEGFGTQDEEGKERLIDAISAIQDDFKKIIVITHLEDLKELFPARIEVTKKLGQGSVVTVI
jgi:exonuclease SbcC